MPNELNWTSQPSRVIGYRLEPKGLLVMKGNKGHSNSVRSSRLDKLGSKPMKTTISSDTAVKPHIRRFSFHEGKLKVYDS